MIGRAERRINVGAFAFAALLLDVVLWVFVLAGWETATIPPDFARTHQAAFEFPYSHGLLASLGWSVLVGAGSAYAFARPTGRAWRAGALIGAAVFSHWVLDALVHVPELPLVGPTSTKVGLGLWQELPIGLGLEAAIVVLGLWLFVPGAPLTRGRKRALVALCLVLLAFTIAGMTLAPPPPSAAAMAGSSLVTLLIVCALIGWIGVSRSASR
ncbi:MAG TPA: hypothetical protein VMG60_08865 [Burkholderiaceae bacterium]|nr:hypothetical protein [Burkholderiaceae bacterium]